MNSELSKPQCCAQSLPIPITQGDNQTTTPHNATWKPMTADEIYANMSGEKLYKSIFNNPALWPTNQNAPSNSASAEQTPHAEQKAHNDEQSINSQHSIQHSDDEELLFAMDESDGEQSSKPPENK